MNGNTIRKHFDIKVLYNLKKATIKLKRITIVLLSHWQLRG